MNNRVLLVAHGSGAYGANQSLINIVSALKLNGVFVLTVIPSKGEICDIFDLHGFDYKIIKYSSELCSDSNTLFSKIINFLRRFKKNITNSIALKQLKNLVIINNINIIHSNSAVVKIGFDLAIKNQIMHIWHLREYIHPNYDLFVFGGFENYIKNIQNSDKIISISKGIAQRFNVLDKSIILSDAVRKYPKYSTPLEKDKYFLFCGSLHRNKGIEEAILAFYQVFNVHNNYKLIIVGTGEIKYEVFLKKKVNALKMKNNILFYGFRNDVDDLMAKATAFLMCSRNEALGRVTIEAMLNFCLVFGYNDSGTSEIINNGKTGFLYNSKDELVSLMLKSIQNLSDFNYIIENAYDFAKSNYLEHKFGNNLIHFYHRD